MKQFNTCLASLKRGTVLLVHDFSQNILLYSQDKPQGHHWDHEQITVHPMVAYYICDLDCCKGKLVKEELIHLTPNLKHNDQAVMQFIEKSLEHLQKKGVIIENIHEFTDQCSNQYKNKNTFYMISNKKIPATRHFYAVKHGKGPSDQAGSHFKRWLKRVIKDPHLYLTTCKEFVEYAILHYTKQIVCTGDNSKSAHSLTAVFIMRRYCQQSTLKMSEHFLVQGKSTASTILV